MQSDLIIQTLTDGRHRDWLEQCCQSVRENLPDGARHVIQACNDHQMDTLNGYSLGKYFATVDHDDVVVNDSIRACMEALGRTGAGIAFTYEAQMGEEGNDIPITHGPVRYWQLTQSPRAIHHLAVFRTDCVSPEVWRVSRRVGIAVDWFTKAWVALNHGAVQVPIIGYKWRRHRYSLSSRQDGIYYRRMPEIQSHIIKWYDDSMGKHGHTFIPRFDI